MQIVPENVFCDEFVSLQVFRLSLGANDGSKQQQAVSSSEQQESGSSKQLVIL